MKTYKCILQFRSIAICIAIISFIAVSCTKEVMYVSVSPKNISIQVGQTYALTAEVAPEKAHYPKPVWASSNPAAVTVMNGIVKGMAPGSSTVTFTAGGISGSCVVTVISGN